MIMRYFPQDNVGLWDKISYSCGVIGKNLSHGIITTLILLYCLQVLQFNSSFLVSIFLLSLIIEGVCSLFLGITFDNCRSRLGKYKLWILLGTISSIICSCWFFALPLLTTKSLHTYLGLIFILMNCCFLFIQLPYLVLISSFSSNSHMRNLIATMPSAGNFISRQILFIVSLCLLTPSLNIFNWSLEIYYYILWGACAILIVSQCIFLICIHCHQVRWRNRNNSMAHGYLHTINTHHAHLGRATSADFSSATKTTETVDAADSTNSDTSASAKASADPATVNTDAAQDASPSVSSSTPASANSSQTESYPANSVQNDAAKKTKTPTQSQSQLSTQAKVASLAKANAQTDAVSITAIAAKTNAALDANKAQVQALHAQNNTQTQDVVYAHQDSQNQSSNGALNGVQRSKFVADVEGKSGSKVALDADTNDSGLEIKQPESGEKQEIFSVQSNASVRLKADESASGAAYAALSAHATYTASAPALPREPYTSVENDFGSTGSNTGIAGTILDPNNKANQGTDAIEATAVTQATYTQATYPAYRVSKGSADTNDRYQSFSRYNNLQHYANVDSRYGEAKEPYGSSQELPKDSCVQHFDVRSIVTVLFKNDQLMIMVLIAILQYGQFSMMNSLLSFFFINNDLLSNFITFAFLILGFLAQLSSMLLFPYFAQDSRRTQVFIKASLCVGIAFILHFILQGSDSDLAHYIEGLLFILINIGMGSAKVAMTTMVADTVDYGEFKLSQRTDALVFAYLTSAYRLGVFLSCATFFTDDITSELYNTVDYIMPMSLEMMFEMILICSFLLAALLLYKCFYKLNGTFYRNVLNNLQFLRQNQRAYGLTNSIKKHFMLRYSLDVNAMLIKLKAKSESEVIQAMVQKLSEVNAISSEHDYMCDLKARLAIGPCGIAEGIAIPHAKSSAVRRATVVVATLDTPIDLGALDDKKCDLIFLLASPDDGVTHMNLLGRLSLLLNEPGFADRLRSSGSSTELFERLIKCEKNIVN